MFYYQHTLTHTHTQTHTHTYTSTHTTGTYLRRFTYHANHPRPEQLVRLHIHQVHKQLFRSAPLHSYRHLGGGGERKDEGDVEGEGERKDEGDVEGGRR